MTEIKHVHISLTYAELKAVAREIACSLDGMPDTDAPHGVLWNSALTKMRRAIATAAMQEEKP